MNYNEELGYNQYEDLKPKKKTFMSRDSDDVERSGAQQQEYRRYRESIERYLSSDAYHNWLAYKDEQERQYKDIAKKW